MKIISVFLNESSQIVLGKLVRAKIVFFVCLLLIIQAECKRFIQFQCGHTGKRYKDRSDPRLAPAQVHLQNPNMRVRR